MFSCKVGPDEVKSLGLTLPDTITETKSLIDYSTLNLIFLFAPSEAIYFPAHVSQGYEEKQRAQDATSDSKYKKDALNKMKTNKFNVADSEHYQKNEELRKHQSDVAYKAESEKDRSNFTSMAVTKEMEQAEQLNEYKVCTFCRNVFKLAVDYLLSSIPYLITGERSFD